MRPRILVTPHVGGYTEESVERAVRVAVDNLLACLNAPSQGATS